MDLGRHPFFTLPPSLPSSLHSPYISLLSLSSPPKMSPRDHSGKEQAAEGCKFATVGRPTTWDTTAGQHRSSLWPSGCLNPINRSCGGIGLHSHIVEPRLPAVMFDITPSSTVAPKLWYSGKNCIVLPVRDGFFFFQKVTPSVGECHEPAPFTGSTLINGQHPAVWHTWYQSSCNTNSGAAKPHLS